MGQIIAVRLHDAHIVVPVPVKPLIIPREYIKSSVCVGCFFRSFRRRHIFRGSEQSLWPPFQIGASVLRLAVSLAEIEERVQTFFLRNAKHLHLKGLDKTLHRNIIVGIHIPAVHQFRGKILYLMGPNVGGRRRNRPLRRKYDGKAYDHGKSHQPGTP